MIEIGGINYLVVARETESGYYLKDDDQLKEIFLPPALAPKDIQIGDELEVFIYTDNKGSLIATTQIPHAIAGEYALLDVIEVQEFGAFFDWGIDKDLLVPGNEQKEKVKLHYDYIVRVCVEEGTNRVFGTTKLGKYIEDTRVDLTIGEKVKMVIGHETELGFRVIINRKYIGIIYHSEIFKSVRVGHEYDGYVKKLRDDNLIDAALQIQGIKNLDQSKLKILEMLKEQGGKSSLHDKSTPRDIENILGMSKKTFKNAIGMLYKDKKIIISKTGIELVKK